MQQVINRTVRWRELRLVVVAAVAFGAAEATLLPGIWPLSPFPDPAPVEVVALLGLLFGFALRRSWVPALPLVTLMAIGPPESGFSGSIIALLVLWPFAATGAFVGISAGRWLRRRILRRTLKAARRPAKLHPPEAGPRPALRATRTKQAQAG
jgi:hypothetical protein